MTSATGAVPARSNCNRGNPGAGPTIPGSSRSPPVKAPLLNTRPTTAFTLIELILVLAILSTVLAVSAPSLKRFFRGRNLDSEATRLIALTRHGQSRAVSEGIPMLLWFDVKARRYGLEADPTWTEDDRLAVEFDLAEDLELQLQLADLPLTNSTLEVLPQSTSLSRPTIRFQPDGAFADTSPSWILLQGRNDDEEGTGRRWIAPGLTRLNYEIWTNQPILARR